MAEAKLTSRRTHQHPHSEMYGNQGSSRHPNSLLHGCLGEGVRGMCLYSVQECRAEASKAATNIQIKSRTSQTTTSTSPGAQWIGSGCRFGRVGHSSLWQTVSSFFSGRTRHAFFFGSRNRQATGTPTSETGLLEFNGLRRNLVLFGTTYQVSATQLISSHVVFHRKN